MATGLSAVQRSAIVGASKAAPGMFKPRKVIVDALVRRGYATRTHTGAIKLTAAGEHFATTGEERT